jgi:hypothetical protein
MILACPELNSDLFLLDPSPAILNPEVLLRYIPRKLLKFEMQELTPES